MVEAELAHSFQIAANLAAAQDVGSRVHVYSSQGFFNPFLHLDVLAVRTEDGAKLYRGDRGAVSRLVGGPDLYVDIDNPRFPRP